MSEQKKIFDEQILPLLQTLRTICEAHNINAVAFVEVGIDLSTMFHIPHQDGSSLYGPVIFAALGIDSPDELPVDVGRAYKLGKEAN